MSRQPLTRETANPNAATAAASAFMRRDSNPSLSSAAAAAALRARPMTPTNVAEVQSKRLNRRSPSVSSLGGRDRGSRRELQRTPSVGSMIERTFRSPSPGRSPMSRDRNVPPVPSIPNVDRIVADRKTNGEQRKGATLQTQTFKTASEKMRDGEHGSWFGGATAGDPDNVRRSDSVLYSAASVPEPRSGSVSPSINFSYPRARMHSPSPSSDDQALVYDPNSRRMVPQDELVTRSQRVRQTSEKPKKKTQDAARSGSYLSRGTVGRTQAPGLEAPQPLPTEAGPAPVPAIAAEQPPAAAKTKRKKKKAREQLIPVAAQEQTPEHGAVDAAEAVRPPAATEPSLVEEEPEREEQQDQHANLQPTVAVAPATAVQVGKGVANGHSQALETRQPDAVRKTRPSSESPVRSAHFAPAKDQLAVRHEPPPRSVSPRKSAMKSASPRGMSPSDDGSEASGRGSSPQRPEDPASGRKKSARVSWDDRNTVVVGEAVQPHDTESPIIPSPQAKKPWHNVVTKYAKKDAVNFEGEETMSPRPALPLFGSVREKKVKEPEERPLVRPSERTRPQPGSALSEPSPEAVAGQSSDAAAGAAFMQDQASRNAANISKYREPFPPIVTSVEGSAFLEDDLAESSDDDLDTDVTTEPDDSMEKTPSKSAEGTERLLLPPSAPIQSASEAATNEGQGVPIISVSHPSPLPQDPKENRFSNEFLDLPGGFPKEDFADAAQSLEHPADGVPVDDAPSTPSRSAEPQHVTPPIMDDIEEEDTDQCSIYSDAYEDLGEVDGEGFMSLDAVVESPAGNKVAKKIHEQVLAQPSEFIKESPEPPIDARQSLDGSKLPKEWENAKSYWKSLSTDQRRRLEIEALSDGGGDAAPELQPAVNKDGRKVKHESSKAAAKPVQPLHDERSYQIQPGTKWSDDASSDAAKRATVLAVQPEAPSQSPQKLRRSMRSEQNAAQAVHDQPGSMRRSMRTGTHAPSSAPDRGARRSHPPPADVETNLAASAAGVGMRKSMRGRQAIDGASQPSSSQSGRPVSYNPPVATKSSQIHKRNTSADVFVTPTINRRGSDDSVSSFTRARAGSSSGMSFRRSMRAQEPPSPIGAKGSGRFSLRSLSPPAFRRNSVTSIPSTSNSFGGGQLRQSLRSEPAETGPRSRVSPFKQSPGGKKNKKTKGGSRFADSSDEDEPGPFLFSSRFADSSDEDDIPRPQSKGKGLPKSLRGNNRSSGTAPPVSRNVASPDLPDSGDDMAQPRPDALLNGHESTLRRSRSGRGTLVPVPAATDGETATRPGSKRRGSFMSILRRKKDAPKKISRDVGESAARRDTRLERTPSELAMIRRNSLQKIGPSWPLPEPEDEDAGESTATEARPSTAHGPTATSSKPTAFLQRRSTSQGIAGHGPALDAAEEVPPVPELPPQHKKKKFGVLRKMFGIHD